MNTIRKKHFYAFVRDVRKKLDRQTPQPAYINTTTRSFPLAHNRARVLPVGIPIESPIASSPDSPGKIPYTDVRQAEKSVKTIKITPNMSGAREKENRSRHPLSLVRKSSQSQSTDHYLDHLEKDDALTFYPCNVMPTKLTIGEPKPLRGLPSVEAAVSARGDAMLPMQETDQKIIRKIGQQPVPDFDLYNFPPLVQYTTRDQAVESLHIRRMARSINDTVNPSPVANSMVFPTLPLAELPIYQAAAVLAIQKINGCELVEAERALAELNAEMFEKFSHASGAEDIENIWLNQFSALSKDMAMLLSATEYWLGENALHKYHEIDHQGAVNLGIKDYEDRQYDDYVGKGVQSYWQMLERVILATINPSRVKWDGYGYFNVLKAVCTRHNETVPIAQFARSTPERQFNVLLDQAALIAFQAKQSAFPQSAPLSSPASYAFMRARYGIALIQDLEDAQIGRQSIPLMPVFPERVRVWTSGGVLRNVVGLNAKGIANVLLNTPFTPESGFMLKLIEEMPGGTLPPMTGDQFDMLRKQFTDVLSIPEFGRYAQRENTVLFGDAWLTSFELEEIVTKRMQELLLNTAQPMGSPQQAISTFLLRYGAQHGVTFDSSLDLGQLLIKLHQMDASWSREPRFPVKPSVMVAFYLADTLGIVMLDLLAGNSRLKRISMLIEQRYAPLLAHDTAAQEWLHDFLPSLDNASENFNGIVPDVIKPLLSSIVKSYRAYCEASETLNYNNQRELLSEINKLFSNVLKAYLPLPVAHEDAEIRKLLKNDYGMTDADIDQARPVSFRTNSHISITDLMTPLAEFKAHSATKMSDMRFNGQSINIDKDRVKIHHRLKRFLATDPVVRNRVLQMLRLGGVPFTQTDFNTLFDAQLMTILGVFPESEGVLAAMMHDIYNRIASGNLLRIAELFPFVTGAEGIIKGIGDGSGTEVLNGMISIGEDALLGLAFGAAGSAMRMVLLKAAEKIAGGTLLSIADSALKMSLEELAISNLRMYRGEAASVGALSEMALYLPGLQGKKLLASRKVEIDLDPHRINMRSTPDPTSFKALAANLFDGVDGENPVPYITPTKEEIQLVYLPKEKKIAAVRKAISCLVECTLTSVPVRNAPPIFLTSSDPVRLNLDEHGGSEAILREVVMNGPTLKPLIAYFEEVAITPEVTDFNEEITSVFHSFYRFKNPNHPTAARFKKFFLDGYEYSKTMRVMINHALVTRDAITEIEFDAERARATGNLICFSKPDELRNAHYMSASSGAKSFSEDRGWGHEIIHDLTKLKDVDNVEAGKVHRGPVVFLNDLFLYEIAQARGTAFVEPRISYNKMFFDAPEGREKVMAPEQVQHIVEASNRMIAEDFYADEFIHPITDRLSLDQIDTSKTLAERRITVLQAQKMNALSAQNRHLPLLPLSARLSTLMDQVIASASDDDLGYLGSIGTGETLRAIAADVQRPLMKSQMFNDMYVYFSAHNDIKPIKIALAQLTKVDSPLEVFQIIQSSESTTILLNTDPVYYYGPYGPRLMPLQQRLIDAYVNLFQPAELRMLTPLYPDDPLLDRGQPVLMANLIMSMAEKPPDSRICREVTSRADSIHPYQSSATRMAKAENRVLNTVKLHPVN
ncbi:hypothetical protein ACVBEF_02230 [Glaciimonas sp. GG7]